MRISNEIKTRWIELVYAGAERENYPAYRFMVRWHTENIQVEYDHAVWISERDLENFLNALIRLHEERKTPAVLHSMSPGEFSITFKPIDKSGHLAVTATLSKEDRFYRDYSFSAEVGFQVDPTCLPTVVNDFVHLARETG